MTFVGEPRPVRPVRMKAGELAEPIATFAAHLSGCAAIAALRSGQSPGMFA